MDPQALREKFETLLGVVQEVEASSDEREAIKLVILNVSELGYPNVMISLLDESKKPAVIRAVEAFGKKWEMIKEETVREFPGDDILAKVLERGEPKFVLDSRIDPECEQGAIEKSGIISQYVIPIVTKEMRIGTMQVHMGKCERKPDLPCKMLDALAAHLSLAVSRFRALNRLREANEVIMSHARFAIANEVATAMIHQLLHEIQQFDGRLQSMLKQPEKRQNSVAFKVLTGLQKEVAGWKSKLDKPLEFVRVQDAKTVCSANSVVRETLEYWYDTVRAQKCNVKIHEIDKNVKIYIQPSHLREALSCLIVNALQAHAHIIEIRIEKSLEYCGAEDKEECAVMRVSDNGDGIAEDLVSEVFKQGFTTKRKRGTGMGLFIVKRLATAMSGDVFLESGGKSSGRPKTTFKFIIPTANSWREENEQK